MPIHVWGTDFRRSSSEFRSQLFLPHAARNRHFSKWLDLGFQDVVYLHTCNRVEFYTTARDHFTDLRSLWLLGLGTFGLTEEEFYCGYQLEGKSALRHLLRVSASLESLVLGESQILGQLKEAYSESGKIIEIQPYLSRCFQLAFETAKYIRTETALSSGRVSTESLAFAHLQGREHEITEFAIVGRSSIAVSMLRWILNNRPQCRIHWVNRSPELLRSFPECTSVNVLSLSEFLESPPPFSHLFTATSSAEPLFGMRFINRISEHCRLVFDFAQPPDVVVEAIKQVELIRLDDLMLEAKENRESRRLASDQATVLIERALDSFYRAQKETPFLKEFGRVECVTHDELKSALSLLESSLPLPSETFSKLAVWADRLVKRNLHISREHLRNCLKQAAQPISNSSETSSP